MSEEVRPGYKRTEVGVIPQDWDIASFDTLGSVIDGDRGVNYPGSRDFSSDGHCMFLNAGNVTKSGFRFSECAFISSEKDEQLSKGKLRRHDIVLTTRGTVGNFAYYDIVVPFEQMRINSGMVILRNQSPVLDTKFLYILLQSRYAEMQIERLTFGSAQPQLTVKAISKFSILTPPLSEQRAIAEALSDVDALLGALNRLIAKKRDLKQAAMQQLLTGQTRLPGFHGEWEVKRLGDCLFSQPDYGINAAAVSYSDKLPRYIRITDISEHGQFCPNPQVSVNAVNADQYFLYEGDIVFARTGASVGKSYLYQRHDGILVFAGFLIRVRPNPAFLVSAFLAAYVTTKPYWDWVCLMSMRSGQPGINGNEYSQLPLLLPDVPEQSAIATVLSDMDAELSALTKSREKTQALKQGMMQELLTGKTRLLDPGGCHA